VYYLANSDKRKIIHVQYRYSVFSSIFFIQVGGSTDVESDCNPTIWENGTLPRTCQGASALKALGFLSTSFSRIPATNCNQGTWLCKTALQSSSVREGEAGGGFCRSSHL
jgi:hypothetical protein